MCNAASRRDGENHFAGERKLGQTIDEKLEQTRERCLKDRCSDNQAMRTSDQFDSSVQVWVAEVPLYQSAWIKLLNPDVLHADVRTAKANQAVFR